MSSQLQNLQRKVDHYRQILANTEEYRQEWKSSLKQFIMDQLQSLISATKLDAEIETREEMENLEAIVLNLGISRSGMYQELAENLKRHLIKNSGALVYQQLFNGKIIVLINYPFIENYGQPRPPKTIAIYRPEELKEPFFVRHLEEFISDITNWEDYDDDEPNKRIGFKLNFEGDSSTGMADPGE